MKKSKLVLVLISGDRVMAAMFARFANALSHALDCNNIAISEIRASNGISKIIKKEGNFEFLNIKLQLLSVAFTNIAALAGYFMKIRTGIQLSEFVVENVPVGIHIYDSILRRERIATIDELSIKQRIYLVLEIAYYFVIRNMLKKLNPNVIVLPDNTYRQGPIFEYLQRFWTGDLFVGIDMNLITVHRYKCPVDHSRHCRTPDLELIAEMEGNQIIRRMAKLYFERRKTGSQAQHDVIRAYDQTKSMVSREELQNFYRLDPNKKIVLIMAHIFSDAPHGYPNAIFRDYKEWLINTCQILNENTEIEFLIKEHPSVSLYGEEGVIEQILRDYSFDNRLLRKNINTASLFSSVDYIVTCGGTAAMEFAAEGVPVIVASKPPYWELGFCSVAVDQNHYRSILSSIQEIKVLDEKSRTKALLCLYAINYLYGLDREKVGFGSQNIFKGSSFSEEIFFEEIAHTELGSIEFSHLREEIAHFIDSHNSNLISRSKYNLISNERQLSSSGEPCGT